MKKFNYELGMFFSEAASHSLKSEVQSNDAVKLKCLFQVNVHMSEYLVFHIIVFKSLTRALEGGAKNAHPSGFSRIAEKQRRAAPPFFQYLLTIEFDTLCKNFSLRSSKVRSPGQVKVKNGFLTLRLRSGHTRYPIGFKPSAFHKVIDTYNLFISDF